MNLGIGLTDKILYVIDIRFKQKNLDLAKYEIDENAKILSLTPYSEYLLINIGKEYKTFDNIVELSDFYNDILSEYNKIENIFVEYTEYSFIFRNLAFIQTYEVYIKYLVKYINYYKINEYKIIYITDSEKEESKSFNLLKNSYLDKCVEFNEIFIINSDNNIFYNRNKLNFFLSKNNILKKIYTKYTQKNIDLNYDNQNFSDVYHSLQPYTCSEGIDVIRINKFIDKLKSILIKDTNQLFVNNEYKLVMSDFNLSINKFKIDKSTNVHPFTFLTKYINYAEILYYKSNNIPKVFMQHGSYLQENIFLKYNEIYPSDVNFVFNDFTRKLFEKRGAKKVYSVGSINFNYPILEKQKKYDFLYITYCTSYSYAGVIVGSTKSLLSPDANKIYNRHKQIIELFGSSLKDKQICIKIQMGILTGSMLYIPLFELSKKFKNITIEFSVPIQNLIPKSRYIISDYFSSEFINRELHYKRDIILFKGSPLPLPEEVVEDMEKMFLLVDTVEDLEEMVSRIKTITKDRKRYDDIIEYYSSKNCNTKKEVTEILENEFDGR